LARLTTHKKELSSRIFPLTGGRPCSRRSFSTFHRSLVTKRLLLRKNDSATSCIVLSAEIHPGRCKISGPAFYWAALILGPNAGQDITAEQFQAAARQWSVDHGYHRPSSLMQLIRVARPWLRFLGWWKVPVIRTPFQVELDRFCNWMKSERGLTATTIDQWRRRTRTFLQWYESAGRSLGELVPSDIDQYLIYGSINGRCRITVATYLTALRAFIRYAGSQGWCTPRLADTIQRPRLYKDERLPSGPDWSHVRLLLQDLDTGHPRDVRNYAIVLLLAWIMHQV
jgi:integrase/recombinase XerD